MNRPVLIFDGLCYACHWIVKFSIARDPKGHLCFASFQSDAGREYLKEHQILLEEINSSVLIEGGKVYFRSKGALRMMRYLRFPWPLLYIFILTPPFIRDGLYRLVARKRFDWFGKMDACLMPAPELQERFLN